MSEMHATQVLNVAAVAIGATMFMDGWNLLLKRAMGIPSLNFCLLGRWIRHMGSGAFRHASIASASKKSYECAVGWSAHYLIGLSLGATFIAMAGDWLAHPTLLPALAFGVATVLFPYFVLQPALGFGVASSRAPKPRAARLKSLTTHAIFGVGLFLAAQIVVGLSRIAT